MCKSGMTNRNLEWQQEPEREKSQALGKDVGITVCKNGRWNYVGCD